CARCTRFAEQIAGDPFIELYERGGLEQVAVFEDEPFRSHFSGNIIQICPVGALTSTSYRFRARPFDVVTSQSVCDHCSAGCTLTVQSRRGEIQRQLARTNMDVNEEWNCDRGRFAFRHVTSDARITEPMLRTRDGLQPVEWARALRTAASAIRKAGEAGTGRVAVLTGGRLADEDAYAASRYARTILGTDDVTCSTRFAPPGETEEFAAMVANPSATYADVEAAPVIVVAGLDSEEEVPILHLRLRKAWRNRRARIVVVGPFTGTLADLTWRHVPTAPGQEAATLARLSDATADGVVGEVATALAEADRPVVLVGERAGASTLSAAAGLASSADGSIAYVPRRAGARGALDAGLSAGLLPGGRLLVDAADRAEVEAVWGPLPATPGRSLQQVLTAAAAGEIDVLHLIGVDLLRDAASVELARAALERTPTVIVQDLARNDTLDAFADVVLPATARQEREGTATNLEGRSQRFHRAIDAPGQAQDDWRILRQLAAVIGGDLGFDDLDAIRAERARLGVRATAHAFPPVAVSDDAPVTGDDLTVVARPLLLDEGVMLRGADDLLATRRAPVAVVAPEDAERLGIVDGTMLEFSRGDVRLTLPARVDASVVPGVVVVPSNSTSEPIGALADREGRLDVVVTVATPVSVGEGA
ncbi:MAG: molybdopterin-dependent oxidoreductase, partial [Nitriliruptoraceae bacterium]